MHTGETDYFDKQELFEAVGIETLHSSEAVERKFLWGYGFDDGTFQMEETVNLVLPDQTELQIPYQLRRVQKNALDVVVLNIGQIEEYDQWQYMTRSGVEVTLAFSGGKGLILADRDGSFITVNTLDCFVSGGYTKEVMEAFAETFDFSKVS